MKNSAAQKRILAALEEVPHLKVDLYDCLADLSDKSDCEYIEMDVYDECGKMGLSSTDREMLTVRFMKRMIAAWQAGVSHESDRIADCI